MKTLIELMQARSRAVGDAKALLAEPEKQGRDFTQEEEARWDGLMSEMARLDGEIARTEEQRELERGRAKAQAGRYFDAESRLLRPGQEVRDAAIAQGWVESGSEKMSLGRLLRAMALGSTDHLTELESRALAEGTVGAGGAMVPTILAAEIIDRARAASVTIQAGTRTFPMESNEVKLARVTGDPSANWKSENAAITDADFTFDTLALDAETVVVLTKASRELVEDAKNLEESISAAFAELLASRSTWRCFVDRERLRSRSGSGTRRASTS